jgi:hypothetical protein
MRDGKVAKIEEIPSEQTKEARDGLRDKLKETIEGVKKDERKTFTKIKRPHEYETFSKDSLSASAEIYEQAKIIEQKDVIIEMK